jgi:hypothetical protein
VDDYHLDRRNRDLMQREEQGEIPDLGFYSETPDTQKLVRQNFFGQESMALVPIIRITQRNTEEIHQKITEISNELAENNRTTTQR